MATIHKSIDIDAPAERVFEILTDPRRLPEYASGLISVEDIRQTEQHIGDSFRATYAALGLHFAMTFTATEYEPPTKLTRRFERGHERHLDLAARAAREQYPHDDGNGV